MTAPTRGVLAFAVAASRCPIQDSLNAATYPARRFGLLRPDRLDGLHDEADIDYLDGEIAEMRVHICIECRRPLAPVLRVAPARLMCRHVGGSACLERHGLGRCQFRLIATGTPGQQWVVTIKTKQPPLVSGSLPCFGERDQMIGA